jgi:hypothetical protein
VLIRWRGGGSAGRYCREACDKKEIILFDYAVPFGEAAAYILLIPPLIDTRT